MAKDRPTKRQAWTLTADHLVFAAVCVAARHMEEHRRDDFFAVAAASIREEQAVQGSDLPRGIHRLIDRTAKPFLPRWRSMIAHQEAA